MLEKSKLAQHAYKGHKICWNEAKVLHIEPNTTYRKYKESAHRSLIDHPISQPRLDIPDLDSGYISRSKNCISVQCRMSGKICVSCDGTIKRFRPSNDDFYLDRPHVCRVFVLALADSLHCAWLVYPIWCWYRCPEIRASSIDWAQMSMFYLKTVTESSL
jgi:hypothetical protein